MRISELFKGMEIHNLKNDFEVNGITYDSRRVKPGFVFVAISGHRFDGHNFIKEAENRGAVGFVAEKKPNTDKPFLIVKNARKYMGEIGKRFYKEALKELKVIGITGTNGKTTTSFFTQQILNAAGIKTALLGTVHYDTLTRRIPATRTTPESIDIFELMNESVKNGAQVMVMEVSSAGLKEKRVDTIDFHAGTFLNFSREHLEYHTDMNDYFNSKKKLFTELNPEYGIFNADCEYSSRIMNEYNGKILSFGLLKGDITGDIIENSLLKLVIKVKGKINGIYTLPLGLKFNVYNFLAALSIAYIMGLKSGDIKTQYLNMPPGRMEFIENKKKLAVFVDYAHTKEAIEKLLLSVKPYVTGRLIIVFGAGGDRDRGKRALMGKAATSLAHVTVITSDNPRSEKPESIINDILQGVIPETDYIIEPDRKRAIELAIKMMKKDDVLLIAGKGHETYQEIDGKRYPFDDRQIAKEILEAL